MLYSINKYPTLSHEYLNMYVSDFDIYRHYLGASFEVNKAFNSPFHEDRNPSFAIYDIGGGKLLYKDHSKGLDGNAVMFVKEKLHLPDFKSALIQIYVDLVINTKKLSEKQIQVSRDAIVKRNVDLGVKRQQYSITDSKYWARFDITKSTLKLFEVEPIKYMFVGPYIKHEYTKDNPMYVMQVYDKFKIYRPLADKRNKWYGSLTRNYIFGFKQLPETGDTLIITKSLKDVMCLYSLGYTAISPSSEGTLIPEHVIKQLKKRFKRIVVLYDNDEAGLAYASKLSTRYNLESTIIPLSSGEKDTSDYFKKYGEIKTKQMLSEILVSQSNNKDEKKDNQEEDIK